MANMTFKASLLPSSDFGYSLGSNDINNLKRWKINGFSGGPIEYIVGGQTAATGSWTGTTQDSELTTGKVIAYKLPFAGSGNASLTLTFTNPTGDSNSGAIPVYLNNSRVTTHYAANSVIIMVYDGASWRSTDYWNSNSRDAGYGKINLTQSNATTAITTNTTQLAAHTYNEAMTLTAGNKWVQFQGTNSGSNNADVLTVGHSLSGVTAGDYGDDSDQTPSYGGTFNVPTLSVDAAGHITAISTHSVKIPASDDTDVKQRIYGSATNVELPIPGINGSASTTATVPSIGTSYKDTYAAIPTANIATINPSTGKITIPGGLKVGVGNSTRMPTMGIEIHDTRTEEFTPGVITKGINFFFTNKTNPVGDSWCSGIYVHGWTGPYAAWCLTGPAGEADVSTKPLYVRTSKNATTWGAYRKIYDTSNKPTPSEILDESDTTKFWRGDNSWSNELTDNLKVKTLTITDTNATEHLKFSRSNNYNYITIPNNTAASLAFGHGIGTANTLVRLTSTTWQPERTNEISLGVSGTRWSKLYVGTTDSYGSTTQPIYWNAGIPTAITYTANRLYYPSTVNSFTAGTHFVSDTKIAINSTSNPSQTLYVEGQTKINSVTATSATNESSTLIVSNSDSGNVALELWRNENASWQLANESGVLYLRNNYTTAKQSSYTQDSLIIDYNTGNTAISGSLSVGRTTRSTGAQLYVNGTSYHNGNDTHAGNINPEANNTRGLGISGTRWKNLFIGTADSYGDADRPIYWDKGVPTATTYRMSGTNTVATTARAITENLETGNWYVNGTDSTDLYSQNTGAVYAEKYNNKWIHEIYGDYRTGQIAVRGKNNGTWQAWRKVLDTENYASLIDGRYVNVTGDTMTGALNLNAENLETATTNVSATTYGQALIRGQANDGSLMSYIQWGRTASTDTTRPNYNFTTYGTRNYDSSETSHTNSLILYEGPNGEHSVYVTSPAAWRTALGLGTNATSSTAYLPLAGGTMTGNILGSNTNILGSTTAANHWHQLYIGGATSDSRALDSANPLIEFADSGRTQYAQIVYTDYNNQGGSDSFTFVSNQSDLRIYAPKVYGAVWNDYAEFRETKDIIEPGRCIREVGDDTLILSNERLQPGCEIVSDTYGFAIGESDKCKTPTAASGRVLAYPYEDRELLRKHIGEPVCSGPNGTVSLMTHEEEKEWPSRIIGTISAIPDYEIWNAGYEGKLPIKVNNRIWIRIR